FSSRRRHTRFDCDWSSDVCSSDLGSNACFSSRKAWYSTVPYIFSWKGLRTSPSPCSPESAPPYLSTSSETSSAIASNVRTPSSRSEERRVGKEGRARGGGRRSDRE